MGEMICRQECGWVRVQIKENRQNALQIEVAISPLLSWKCLKEVMSFPQQKSLGTLEAGIHV